MRRVRRSVPVLPSTTVAIAAILISSCGGSDGPDDPVGPPAPSPAIAVTPTTSEIIPTQTTQLSATVTNVGNTAVSWTSSNTGVATVDADGLVRGVSVGEATITATSVASAGTAASAVITVLDPCIAGVGTVIMPEVAQTDVYEGSLEVGDCVDEGGGLIDEWIVEIPTDALVSFSVADAPFDAVVDLLNEDREFSFTFNLRALQFTSEGGTFRIRVRSADGAGSGSYEFRFTQKDRCDISTGGLLPGEPGLWQVTALDCPLTGGFRADLFNFRLTETENVIATVDSDWPSRVALTTRDVTDPLATEPIAIATRGVGGPGAALAVRDLPPGDYRVWVIEEESEMGGDYAVHFENGSFATVQYGPDEPGTVMRGESPIVDLTIDMVPSGGEVMDLADLQLFLPIDQDLMASTGVAVHDFNSGQWALNTLQNTFVDDDFGLRFGTTGLGDPQESGILMKQKIVTKAPGLLRVPVRIVSATDSDGADLGRRFVTLDAVFDITPVPEERIVDLGDGEGFDLEPLAAEDVQFFRFNVPPGNTAGTASRLVVEGLPDAPTGSDLDPEKADWRPLDSDLAGVVFDYFEVTLRNGTGGRRISICVETSFPPTTTTTVVRSAAAPTRRAPSSNPASRKCGTGWSGTTVWTKSRASESRTR